MSCVELDGSVVRENYDFSSFRAWDIVQRRLDGSDDYIEKLRLNELQHKYNTRGDWSCI